MDQIMHGEDRRVEVDEDHERATDVFGLAGAAPFGPDRRRRHGAGHGIVTIDGCDAHFNQPVDSVEEHVDFDLRARVEDGPALDALSRRSGPLRSSGLR